MSDQLLTNLLEIGFSHASDNLSSNAPINNKLELDFATVSQYPDVLKKVTERLCEIVEPYQPEFVMGVPDGATGYAARVAWELDIYNPHLDRRGDREIAFATDIDSDSVRRLSRGALIAAVIDKFTDVNQVLRLDGMPETINIVAGVFDRGKAAWRQESSPSIPHHSAVSKPIPPQLGSRSRLWKYAK